MSRALNQATTVEILAPVRATATANGSAVNVTDYEGTMIVALSSSAGGGTTPTLNVTIEDSADGSTGWAAISGAAFTEVTDAADATEAITIDLDAVKGFIRGVDTITGTSPTFDRALVAVGFKKYR